MIRWQAIRGVALADFRERSRSLTLLVVPVVIAYFVKLATVDATLYVAGEYTGTPNAAWFGGLVAGIATLVFFLFGYPLVTGSISRDRETEVGELLAASPLSNTSYLLGKWLSNVAVLTVATTILVVATTVSFLLQGTGPLNLAGLISPFLLITMPTMAVVAAAAVCFETIGPLRGTLGTVVYFVSVFVLVIASVPPHSPLDFTGFVALRESMASSIAAQYPGFEGPVGSFAYSTGRSEVQTFTWSGIAWTRDIFISRLPVLGTAVALLAVAGVTFDRFSESDDGTRTDSNATGGSENVAVESHLRQKGCLAPLMISRSHQLRLARSRCFQRSSENFDCHFAAGRGGGISATSLGSPPPWSPHSTQFVHWSCRSRSFSCSLSGPILARENDGTELKSSSSSREVPFDY